MFDRVWAKNVAKARLRAGKSNAILVVLILSLLGGLAGGFELNLELPLNTDVLYEETVTAAEMEAFFQELFSLEVLLVFLFTMLVSMAIATAIALFFTNVLSTGVRGWFLRYVRGGNADVGELFASFRIYKPVLCTTLLRTLYTWLWSMLFLIPGIIKSYAYSMADYVIYENPNLTASEALRISEKLTDGAKGDLFVFELSFIGWNILNAFTLGILGIVHIDPYRYTAHAAVYDALKWRAINNGVLSWADFGQLPPVAEPVDPAQPVQTN